MIRFCCFSVMCLTNLQEGENEANSEVGDPVDRTSNHEGSRPGRLPEHLSGHHSWNGTCRVNLGLTANRTPQRRLTYSTAERWIYKIFDYMSDANSASANGRSCLSRVWVNNHRWVRLTRSDGVSYDVDDDTRDTDVRHPWHAFLWEEPNSECFH